MLGQRRRQRGTRLKHARLRLAELIGCGQETVGRGITKR